MNNEMWLYILYCLDGPSKYISNEGKMQVKKDIITHGLYVVFKHAKNFYCQVPRKRYVFSGFNCILDKLANDFPFMFLCQCSFSYPIKS